MQFFQILEIYIGNKSTKYANTAEFTIHVHGAHIIEEGPGFHPIK